MGVLLQNTHINKNQGGVPPPPPSTPAYAPARLDTVIPLPREARKLLRLIKSLEKEDDSLYRFWLLILV